MKKCTFIVLMSFCLSACVTQTYLEKNKQQQNQLSQIYVQMGLVYLKQKQLPLAKEKFVAALDENPFSSTALDAIAYYWEVTGNNVMANKYYLKAIKQNSTSGRALNNYGVYLCRMKQYTIAEHYLLAAGHDPSYVGSAAAMENAGLCALAAKVPSKAKLYFEQALQQDPNRPISAYELSHLTPMQ
jgi:type IV pilus assembly protein PilF